jgi:hypothetical protein
MKAMRSNLILSIAAILATAILAIVALPARAEPIEETIRAFSVWEGHGAFFVPGLDVTTVSATLIGRLYVDTEQGPVDAGMMSCPATVHVKTVDRTQEGSAICAITTKDGAQIFAELNCTGVYMVGCTGEAKITGGTGRFKGVTGGGKFTMRSDLAGDRGEMLSAEKLPDMPLPDMKIPNLPVLSPMMGREEIAGILFFKELHYKVP